MKVGILGSGLMGGKLGTIFARAGHEVVFSYARSEQKLKRLARAAGRRARGGTPPRPARDGSGRQPDPRHRLRSGGRRAFADRPLYRAVHDARGPARLRRGWRPGIGVSLRAVRKIGADTQL